MVPGGTPFAASRGTLNRSSGLDEDKSVEPWWKFRWRSVKWKKSDVALAVLQSVLVLGFFTAALALGIHGKDSGSFPAWGYLITWPLLLANAVLFAARLRLLRRRPLRAS